MEEEEETAQEEGKNWLYQDAVQFESYAASAQPRLLLLLPVSWITTLYFWQAQVLHV